MDRIQSLELFVAVAEAESFVGGGRTLGLSAPSATRGINALEARLGARLFTRTTRRVRLTDIGRSYLEDTRQVLAQLQAADDAATGAATNPVGQLRLTCPSEFGRIHVAPLLTEFLDTYPDVTCDVLMVDRVVNLVEEGFDIAVRIGELPSSSLSAVKVGAVRRVVCAAPSYLEAHGSPTIPSDLAGLQIVAAGPLDPTVDWHFGTDGKMDVRVTPRLRLNSIAASIEIARRGWGLVRVLSYQIDAEIASGALVPVLEDYEPEPLPIHLVHVEGRRAPAKVRAFIDFTADRMRRTTALKT